MIRHWLASWKKRYGFARRQPSSLRRSSFRLRVRDLEGRVVPSLVSAPGYLTGVAPQGAAVGDFTGSGHLDIAYADAGDQAITIVPGNGDGTFQNPVNGSNSFGFGFGFGFNQQVFLGGAAQGLTAADFNGDGLSDLAASVTGLNQVAIVLNTTNGLPAFPNSFLNCTAAPTCIVSTDLTAKGNQDVITGLAGTNALNVFLGKGDGTFGKVAVVPTDFPAAAIAVGDFNGDGHMDVAIVGGSSGDVELLMGNGDGTFQAPVEYATAMSPAAIAVGDFNGDGKPDLVVAGGIRGEVQVLLNNGNGTFTAQAPYADDASPVALAVVDLNRDGHADVVTANRDGGSISVFMGSGDGTLTPGYTYAADTQPSSIVVGDFNGDGIPDVVVGNAGAQAAQTYIFNQQNFTFQQAYLSDCSVFIGNGDGTFQAAPEFAAGPTPPSHVVTADLTGNGKLDAIITNPQSSSVTVLLGDGHGNFGSPMVFSTGAGTAPMGVVVADVNHDGIPDIITANGEGGTVSVLLGNGNGTFRLAGQFAAGSNPTKVVAGDFNHDGKIDLAVSNTDASRSVSVLFGNGNGTFQALNRYTVDGPPTDLVAVDLNGDGSLDLVTCDKGTNNVDVLFNNGDGTFRQPVAYPVGLGFLPSEYPSSIAAGDLNGDGLPDLVIGNYLNYQPLGLPTQIPEVNILFNTGGGTLGGLEYGPSGVNYPQQVQIADLSGTGRPDIIVGSTNSNSIGVFENAGGGAFNAPVLYSAGPSPAAFAVGDFNGDHQLDVIAADTAGNNVTEILSPGAPDVFHVSAPSIVTPGVPFQVTVTAMTPHGVIDPFFNGTIKISSSDAGAVLPGAYPFQPTDRGSHTFVVTLLTNGNDTLTVSDFAGQLPSATTKIFVPGYVAARHDSAGIDPQGSVAADFNGDGKTDLAFANPTSNTISVLLSNGDGTFAAPLIYKAPDATNVAVADLTKDGKFDLIATDPKDGMVNVLLGNGDGSFQPAVSYAAGTAPAQVIVADVNGDGVPDLIVTDSKGSDVAILIGVGAGTFQVASLLTTPAPTGAVVAGDFNGDGKTDLALSYPTASSLQIFTGDGKGSFTAGATYSTLSTPSVLAAADLSGKGVADLIVADSGSNTMQIFSGNGDGTFQNPQDFTTGSTPDALAVADLTGNGRLDIVTANAGSNSVSVFMNQGNGVIVPSGSYAADAGANSVQVADVDGDGHPDLLVGNASANDVSVLFGIGNGTFVGAPIIGTGGNTPVGIATADLNRDGNADLVTADPTANAIGVFLGAGNGTFSAPVYYSTGANSAPQAAAIGDVNGDGNPDVVVADKGSDSVAVFLGNANGTLSPPVYYVVGASPDAITLGDFNGDGKLDIAVANSGDNTVSVLLNNGNGTFAPAVTYATGKGPNGIAAVDLNHDNKVDLVVSCGIDKVVSVLLGAGNGSFQTAVNYPALPATATASLLTGIAVGDVNKDGQPDVVVANGGAGFSLLAGNGDGTLGKPVFTAMPGSGTAGIQLVDFNKDGRLDVVMGGAGNTVSIALGNGDGTFRTPKTYTTGPGPEFVAVADFNRDGAPDVVAADSGEASLTVLATPAPDTVQLFYSGGTAMPGQPIQVTLEALNYRGIVDPGYQGTVHFSSTDPLALLPANYTFGSADHGQHTFTLTMSTPGQPTLSVADTNAVAAGSTVVIPVESSPQLAPIPDQTMLLSSGSLVVSVPPPTDADGDPVMIAPPTVSGYNPAYDLQQQLGLYARNGYHPNLRHANEKWLVSAVNGHSYAILPDGQVIAWNGVSLASSPTIATLDTTVWANPALITNARAPLAPAVFANFDPTSNQLTITPPSSYLGTFRVTLTASDGTLDASQSFLVTVTENRPMLDPIPDQTIVTTPTTIQIPLNVQDGDPADQVSLLGPVVTGYNPAYDMEFRLNLYAYHTARGASYLYNAFGQHEKSLFSAVTGDRYLILPNGEVFQFIPGVNHKFSDATYYTTVDPNDWTSPQFIIQAAAPTPAGITASITGTTLSVNVSNAFTGSARVWVAASDGVLSTTQSFLVTLVNGQAAPEEATVGLAGGIAPTDLPDVALPAGTGRLTVALATADPAGNPVALQASVSRAGDVADLQSQLGLYTFVGARGATYFQNALGHNEKSVFSAVTGDRYLILPNGQIRQLAPNVPQTYANSTLYTTLDPNVWVDPTLLTHPAALPVSATVSNGTLTVAINPHFTGSFWVTVQANNGFTTTSQQFLVTVTDPTPLLGNIPIQALAQGTTTTVNLSVSPGAQLLTTVSPGSQAALLQAKYGFYVNGSYRFNLQHQREKWLWSAIQNSWFVILPNGQLRAYNGVSVTTSPIVATLDPKYWANPALLTNPPASALAVGALGTQLEISALMSSVGQYWVTVFATDGVRLTFETFRVDVVA